MNRTKRFLGIIPILLVLISMSVLQAQIPAAIDTKMKSDNMRNFQVEELKVRWKKAALENCPGVPCLAPVCPTSTVTDIDGNIYSTVAIGTQCWTKENLKVTKYNNNDIIPDSSNSTWGTAAIGALTDYVGVSGYVGTYGYLYNWYAATDSRKICPDGWHVPTDDEWTILILSIDSTSVATGVQSTTAGGKMKTPGTSFWNFPNIGTNQSGFSALGGGFRRSDVGLPLQGMVDNLNKNGWFWSSTTFDLNTEQARFRLLIFAGDQVFRTQENKRYGASIRCIKN
jgi:uncharacterized protein (TIGR02145 family)